MLQCEQCGLQHEDDLLVCPETGKLFRPERIFPSGTLLEGKYRIEGVLGAGGMGAVFRATHTLLNKTVAVKLTLPEFARDEHMTARMVREARAASSTGHRNIAGVTDMGWTDDGGLFIVMEFLRGITLQELIQREGSLPVERAVEIVSQVLSGLSAVHAKGVVHRDLKPENVMLVQDDEGAEVVKVLDFGISKVLGDDKALELTRTGLVMGSPRYMSPEQARGASKVDQRVDIYATGGILYTLIVGRPPLTAENYHAMLAVILANKITPPSLVAADVPKDMDRVILQAMALDPDDRFADAASFRRALKPFVEVAGGAGEAQRPAPAPSAGSHRRDDPLWSADSLVALDEIGAPIGSAAAQSPVVAVSTAELSAPTISGQSSAAPGGVAPPAARRDIPLPAAGSLARPASTGWGGPAQAEALELDLGDNWQGSSHAGAGAERLARRVAPKSTLHQQLAPNLFGSLVRSVGLILGVVLLAGGVWHFREPLMAIVRGEPTGDASEGAVLVLLETQPPEADVYVDGVLQVTKPIELPRSDRLFSIRIQARGYRSRKLTLRADRTRSVRVQLEKQKK